MELAQHSILDFFENYAEAVIVTTATYQAIYLNNAFTALTQYNKLELSLIDVAEISGLKINYNQSKNQNIASWETNFTTKNKEFIWVKVSKSVILLSDKTEGYVYTFIDNRMQIQLKGLLKESENRFTTLADASPVMMWMTDSENHCYYFNKSWLDFTGNKLENEQGKGWMKHIYPDDLKVFDEVSPIIKQRQNYSCEYRLKRSDEIYRNIIEIGTARFLPNGTFAGYMGSCLDVTEIKEAQNEISTQSKELIRSNQELEQFAYVASHDLQEPLRMISSYIQLIEKNIKTGNDTSAVEFMIFVVEGVRRMQSLINDLLQYSRVNSNGKVFTDINLNDTLQITLTHLSHRISEINATVVYDTLPVVKGDSTQLVRLFQNLIENALKFKAPDRNPKIQIIVEEQPEHFLFSLKDNGIGIESKFYNRIFIIFQRLHTRAEYEGTGIGLSICKKIVERHNGNVWLESEIGVGTTFYFTIQK